MDSDTRLDKWLGEATVDASLLREPSWKPAAPFSKNLLVPQVELAWGDGGFLADGRNRHPLHQVAPQDRQRQRARWARARAEKAKGR